MQITAQQKKAIRSAVRAANRRLERAGSGQRRAMEYWVKKYTGGKTKFSAATKGMTYEQAASLIQKLNKFMEAPSTTITGWKKIKAAQVAAANAKLGTMGYDLTDEELADIFIQVDTGNYNEKYRAINLVQVEKQKAYWAGGEGQIAAAIAQKASYQEAMQKAIGTMRR